ncbi:MAG: hypothetical protein HUJ86_03745 [Synergistes sp.]|nr:hypothetical protein [Synergistes sp.]
MTLRERFEKLNEYLYDEELNEKLPEKPVLELFKRLEGSRLAELDRFEGRDLTELKDKISDVIRSAPFDEQLDYVRSINAFFFGMTGNDQERICQVDKLFDKTSTHIRLLKYLQGGEEIGPRRTQEKIARKFCMSPQAMGGYLSELRNGTNILGSDVKIELRPRSNDYDSTIHPIFLALNLTEVYLLTVGLKKALGSSANELIADIFRQLSGYAQEKILTFAERDGVDLFDGKPPRKYKCGYRAEKSNDPNYFLKRGEKCVIKFEDEIPKEHIGYIKIAENGLVFISEKGDYKREFPWNGSGIASLRPFNKERRFPTSG